MSADRNTAGEKTELGKGPGIRFPRYFTIADDDPYDLIEWDSRTALITNNTGEAVFEQRDVRTPTAWSQQAINIVASMYFRGKPDSPERESDIGGLIDRVVNRITSWGYAGGYFRSPDDRDAFRNELKHLIVHQKASFNSPVWFNCGHREKPQCSACFIIAVEDSMESILDLAKTEGMLFKHGSGTGSNLSALRSSGETLNGGGTASGPVSFMKGFDAFAGVIKSGGSCLTGSQPVYTTGGPVRAAELAERENGFVCMSWDPPSGGFKTKHAHAWLSGVKTVLRVRTDGGEFDVSSDHPFRLADGETVTAENLRTDAVLHTYRGATDGPQTSLRVLGVDPLGSMPVYSVEVDCPTADDKTAASGHNFVIWPDDRRDGAGVVVHNTRRAAKMVILNADHPDIVNFIECKAREEKKAWALIDAGYDSSITGDAYTSIFFQNANNSVRVTDAFMKAVADDDPWETLSVTGEQRVVKTYQARDLMRRIAEAAHVCGDPGMQFDTTVNEWHTCPRTDRIRASNPCSEYMFIDDSACNLASINLMKFEDPEHGFDTEAFTAAVRTIITAQEIMVGNASYPTPAIERNSHDYRPLGLGYCNLGAFLMSQALPYDSDDGRAAAGAITALMTGAAYEQSAIIARDAGGPFHGFERNREPFLKVMKKHAGAVRLIESGSHKPSERIAAAATRAWQAAIGIGSEHGFRNAQATVLAPTGTIGFMMDCDTTGVEPDIALVKYKKLVNQGLMKIVNQTVPKALKRLCYDDKTARAILEHIETGGTIENAPGFAEEDLDIFDCAFKPQNGERSIAPSGHIRMIGAVQPFISGAISKTINMPTDTTVDEIERTYIDAWRQGAKSVSIYRDGSKRSQPLTTGEDEEKTGTERPKPSRRRLADERRSITHKFEVGGHEGYVTVGIYKDGTPGEIFIVMAKEGSTISGFADAFAQAISYALQYGVPLEMLVNKFCHQRFEPAGMTRNPKIRMAKSIVDYIVRWMATKFLDEDAQRAIGINLPEKPTTDDGPAGAAPTGTPERAPGETAHPMAMIAAHLLPNDQDAPPCPACGSIMLRNGTCYACPNCGTTSGCS